MQFVIAIMVLMTSQLTFADEVSADSFRHAQLEILRETLKSELGLEAEVKFANELLSPMASYNGVSDVIQGVANVWRSRSDQRYGAGANQVIVDFGLVGYSCQSKVEFKGGLSKENVVFVGLSACASFFTQAADERDTKCYEARHSESRRELCQPIQVLPPSALFLEVRR